MKFRARGWFTASLLLTTDVFGQVADSEIRTIVIDDFPVASAQVRSLAIKWRLDLDHDQFLSLAELDAAIAEASRNVDAGWVRRHLLSDYSYMRRYMLKLSELQLVRQSVAAAGGELSLVSEDFHERFVQLPSEQRHALFKADVDGNNNGTVTAPEFRLSNQRLFRKTSRFESDFGEEAYIEVLFLLGAL